ncbi:hypothetical protein LshimejAT787_0400880 [Lyophyllum shimeji]|uniref:Uncharacterized protein n=1 Tax=Lyophyllum shimeji TaxID=47721 RepID=A0A9P3PKL0_LYOSH|nr:hypothetical protein LshimejAT787_0400880 [Lyophyllum shimeji]
MRPSSHFLIPALTILNWSVGAAYASVSSVPPARSISRPQHDSQKRQFFTADYGKSSESSPKHLYHEGKRPRTVSASTSSEPPSTERHKRGVSVMKMSALDHTTNAPSRHGQDSSLGLLHGILGPRADDDVTIRERGVSGLDMSALDRITNAPSRHGPGSSLGLLHGILGRRADDDLTIRERGVSGLDMSALDRTSPKHLYYEGKRPRTVSASTSSGPPSTERHKRGVSVMKMSALDHITDTPSRHGPDSSLGLLHGILGRRADDDLTIRERGVSGLDMSALDRIVMASPRPNRGALKHSIPGRAVDDATIRERGVSVMDVSMLDHVVGTASRPGKGSRHGGLLGRTVDESTIGPRSAVWQMTRLGPKARAVTTHEDIGESRVELHEHSDKEKAKSSADYVRARLARDSVSPDRTNGRFARALAKPPLPDAAPSPPKADAPLPKNDAAASVKDAASVPSQAKPDAAPALPHSDLPEDVTSTDADVDISESPSVEVDGKKFTTRWMRRPVDA